MPVTTCWSVMRLKLFLMIDPDPDDYSIESIDVVDDGELDDLDGGAECRRCRCKMMNLLPDYAVLIIAVSPVLIVTLKKVDHAIGGEEILVLLLIDSIH